VVVVVVVDVVVDVDEEVDEEVDVEVDVQREFSRFELNNLAQRRKDARKRRRAEGFEDRRYAYPVRLRG